MDCSKRQLIDPAFGQLGSEPETIDASELPHTLLLSNELCHVALPKGSGFGANWLGFASGLRKWVRIWMACPKKLSKRVACGQEALTVHEAAPVLVGRQT